MRHAVVLGIASGVLTLIGGIIGYAFTVVAAAVILATGPRLRGLAGLLLAFGITWFVLLARAQIDCAIVDALPNRECIGPGLERWYAGSLVAIGLGWGLWLLARRGSEQRDRDPLSEGAGDRDEQRR